MEGIVLCYSNVLCFMATTSLYVLKHLYVLFFISVLILNLLQYSGKIDMFWFTAEQV